MGHLWRSCISYGSDSDIEIEAIESWSSDDSNVVILVQSMPLESDDPDSSNDLLFVDHTILGKLKSLNPSFVTSLNSS